MIQVIRARFRHNGSGLARCHRLGRKVHAAEEYCCELRTRASRSAGKSDFRLQRVVATLSPFSVIEAECACLSTRSREGQASPL
jgi:hypothetical protein